VTEKYKSLTATQAHAPTHSGCN